MFYSIPCNCDKIVDLTISILAFTLIIIIIITNVAITIASKNCLPAKPSSLQSSSSPSPLSPIPQSLLPRLSSLSSFLYTLTFKCKNSCAQLQGFFKLITKFGKNYSWAPIIFLLFCEDCFLWMSLALLFRFGSHRLLPRVYGMTPTADRTLATCYT